MGAIAAVSSGVSSAASGAFSTGVSAAATGAGGGATTDCEEAVLVEVAEASGRAVEVVVVRGAVVTAGMAWVVGTAVAVLVAGGVVTAEGESTSGKTMVGEAVVGTVVVDGVAGGMSTMGASAGAVAAA